MAANGSETFQSDILRYRSSLALNSEVFLLNFGQELQAFDDTDKRLGELTAIIARRESDQGQSHVGLIPLLLILMRQTRNAFECLSRYQSYDAWLVFRPGLEALLIVGKFLDDPSNARLWKDRRKIWTNRLQDKQALAKYRKEFEGDGLIPKALPRGREFRSLLSRINNEFMHMNFDYLTKNHQVSEADNENVFIKTSFTGGDSQEHRAFLFSFLHTHRLLASSLGQALSSIFSGEAALRIEVASIERIWEPKVKEMVQQRSDLGEICRAYGFWNV